MDGGGRFARSLRAFLGPDAPRDVVPRRALVSFGRSAIRVGSRSFVVRRGMGSAAALLLIGCSALAGAILGGHYEAFRSAHGAPRDLAARMLGFGVATVAIGGNRELGTEEVFKAAGISAAASLPFLDVGQVRANLRAVPMIADATVRKLFPDHLVITVTERTPFALWQRDGLVHVVSADGTVIDEFQDARFQRLPHVVGSGANLRVKEYAALLDQVPEMKGRIRAGILVSERRWTLKLANGVDVKLPETRPVDALRTLAKLDREAQVLDKDILVVDLRVPGRVAFRLSEEAASQRIEAFEKKLPKVKGRA